MLNLGFTMEELMFPENYQQEFFVNIETNYSLENTIVDISPLYSHQEQIILDEDDWLTVKQLGYDTAPIGLSSDQTLPLLKFFADNNYLDQVKPVAEFDGTVTAFLLPNLSIKIARDNDCCWLPPSDTIAMPSLSIPNADQMLLTTMTNTAVQNQHSSTQVTSKSTSSSSFRTKSSTSISSSSGGMISPNPMDTSVLTSTCQSNESVQKSYHHHKNNVVRDDDSSDGLNRRRRKRTIFTTADIEHLKEAFIQNPKPSQQDIAVLSEQLGHDSYVIRVWFYNKRQATKKRNTIGCDSSKNFSEFI